MTREVAAGVGEVGGGGRVRVGCWVGELEGVGAVAFMAGEEGVSGWGEGVHAWEGNEPAGAQAARNTPTKQSVRIQRGWFLSSVMVMSK